MRIKKFLLPFILAAVLLSFSVHADFEDDARKLYELKLLKGTGDSFSIEALDLDRDATRTEACITLLRMLGKEEKARYQNNPHPFNDVPEWASASIGWLYENWLVNGVGDTYFGARDIATVKQFSAMTLRALGYNEKEGDFAFESTVNKAMEIGLFGTDVAAKYELPRKDMISIVNRAIRTNLKNSRRTLIEKLCDDGAVDRDLAEAFGILIEKTIADSFPDVEENLGEIRITEGNGVLTINFDEPVEHYGLRVFYSENGGPVTELPSVGNPAFEKGEISYKSGQAAGYLNKINIYGLDISRKYSFIVLKTTSEEAVYLITGKSGSADWR